MILHTVYWKAVMLHDIVLSPIRSSLWRTAQPCPTSVDLGPLGRPEQLEGERTYGFRKAKA